MSASTDQTHNRRIDGSAEKQTGDGKETTGTGASDGERHECQGGPSPSVPTPEEIQNMLNREYKIVHREGQSDLSVCMESDDGITPPSSITVHTMAFLTVPENKIQLRLPDEIVSQIVSAMKNMQR